MNSALLRALASWGWLLIALLVSAVVTLLAAVGGFDRADLLFQSYLYDDGAPRWAAPVTVVEIDDASLQAIGPYPWERAAYVRLLQALSEAERRPAVLAFDVGFFDLTEEDPAALAGALDAFPSPVVLAAKAQDVYRTDLWQGGPVSRAGSIQQAQAALRGERARSALANVILDADQRVRRVHAALRAPDGALMPSLSVAATRAYLGAQDTPLRVEAGLAHLSEDTRRVLNAGVSYPPIAAPLDPTGAFCVNYVGDASAFPRVSFIDVVEGRVDPGLLRGRVLLVGATTVELHDIVGRPGLGAAQIPGVDVHAHAIATLLSRDFLLPASLRLTALLTALLSLLAALSGARLSTTRGFGAALTLLLSVPLISAAAFSLYAVGEGVGRVVSLAYPATGVALSYVSAILLRVATEEREKRFLRQAFGQYVSPELVREISADPSTLKLGGDRRELTVLFSDIRGFTALSERLEAQALVALLNEYFDAQTELVFEQKGVIDKFIGDAMMAFWGAPLPQPRQAELACAAALNMAQAVPAFNQETAKRGLPPITMGVGVNTGHAVVGNMGSSKRFDYTAMGDSVNLASRLEGLTKVYGVAVLVSAATREAAGPGFVFRTLDRVKVKGREQTVTVSELLGRGDDAPGWALRFEEGLKSAWTRDWDAAERAFQEVLAARPEDTPAQRLLERVAAWRERPPPADWDGSVAFDHK